MFAESARIGAQLKGITNITFDSSAYGNHKILMKNMDLIILAPQLSVYMDEIKLDAAEYGSNIVEIRGREYIKYTNDP
ncbi:hypothetical protein [Spiroplasma endosymbiont of Virgichneumon dumeticola]|uniref:hypothetical protein n=1 Tax=Spiroplasma endosymbiont of Virgichneumon dumeticola TaxID=3139323 RepID=UPI0035C90206